jgi:hypothetical protein
MTTYLVQAIYGDRFEDLYVSARSEAEALVKASKATTLKSRWTRFII